MARKRKDTGAAARPVARKRRDAESARHAAPGRDQRGLTGEAREAAIGLAARNRTFVAPLLQRRQADSHTSTFATGVRRHLSVPVAPALGSLRSSPLGGDVLKRHEHPTIALPPHGAPALAGDPDLHMAWASLRNRAEPDGEETGDEERARDEGASTVDWVHDRILAPARPRHGDATVQRDVEAGRPDLVTAAPSRRGARVQGLGASLQHLSARLQGRSEWPASAQAARSLPVALGHAPPRPTSDIQQADSGTTAENAEGKIGQALPRLDEAAAMAPFSALPATSSLVASIQRKGAPGAVAPTAAQRTLALQQAATSLGEPLAPPLRETMDQALESDFGAVRVHADAPAAGAAATLRADAFTVGEDVYFGAERFEPASAQGLALLGHELVHTVQQRQGQSARVQRKEALAEPEVEPLAESGGAEAVAGEAAEAEEAPELEAQAQGTESRLLHALTHSPHDLLTDRPAQEQEAETRQETEPAELGTARAGETLAQAQRAGTLATTAMPAQLPLNEGAGSTAGAQAGEQQTGARSQPTLRPQGRPTVSLPPDEMLTHRPVSSAESPGEVLEGEVSHRETVAPDGPVAETSGTSGTSGRTVGRSTVERSLPHALLPHRPAQAQDREASPDAAEADAAEAATARALETLTQTEQAGTVETMAMLAQHLLNQEAQSTRAQAGSQHRGAQRGAHGGTAEQAAQGTGAGAGARRQPTLRPQGRPTVSLPPDEMLTHRPVEAREGTAEVLEGEVSHRETVARDGPVTETSGTSGRTVGRSNVGEHLPRVLPHRPARVQEAETSDEADAAEEATARAVETLAQSERAGTVDTMAMLAQHLLNQEARSTATAQAGPQQTGQRHGAAHTGQQQTSQQQTGARSQPTLRPQGRPTVSLPPDEMLTHRPVEARERPSEIVEGEGSRTGDTAHDATGAPTLAASIQRRAETMGVAPTARERTLALQQAATSLGEPLAPPLRETMDQALESDFGAVRLHADAPAARAVATLRADAFTVGEDVYFGAERFEPASAQGLALLGHELVHTVQQRQDPGAGVQRKEALAEPEVEPLAESGGAEAVAGEAAEAEEAPELEAQAQGTESRLLYTLTQRPELMLTSGVRLPAETTDEPARDGAHAAANGSVGALSGGLGQTLGLAGVLASRARSGAAEPAHEMNGQTAEPGANGHEASTMMTQRSTGAVLGAAWGAAHHATPIATNNHAEDTAGTSHMDIDALLDRIPDEEPHADAAAEASGAARAEPRAEGFTPVTEQHSATTSGQHQAVPNVDELVEQVLRRLKREIAFEHERHGGRLSDMMR